MYAMRILEIKFHFISFHHIFLAVPLPPKKSKSVDMYSLDENKKGWEHYPLCH
jgi:hypothetical protein